MRYLQLTFVLGLCLAVSPHLLAQQLVLQWTFDEPEGGSVDAIDSGDVSPAVSGLFGANATRTTDTPGGGPGFAADLSTEGETSTISGGDPEKVDQLSAFTLTTWVKMTGNNSLDQLGSNNIRLLSKQTGGSFDGFSWNLVAPRDETGTIIGDGTTDPNLFGTALFVGGQNGFSGDFFATAPVEDRGSEWLFMAVTYDGTIDTSNLKFYLGDETDAVAQLGTTLSNGSGPVFDTTGFANFGVGFTDAAFGDFAIPGFQDDVRVYDGVLDETALDAVRLANLPEVSVLPGDLNGDGSVNFGDLQGFVLALTDTEGYATSFPDGDIASCDTNGDSSCNFGDLSGFVDLLTGGGSASGTATTIPEPTSLLLFALAALIPARHFRD